MNKTPMALQTGADDRRALPPQPSLRGDARPARRASPASSRWLNLRKGFVVAPPRLLLISALWAPLLLVLVLLAGPTRAGAQSAAFTYQGRLAAQGLPANGTHDFEFWLFREAVGGKVLGVNTREEVPVSDGVFTVTLDFGTNNIFDGLGRYLEIYVKRTDSTNDLVMLTPRAALMPAPYALLAAGVVDGSVTTAKLADAAVTGAKLADQAITAPKLAANAVADAALADGAVTTAKLADGAVTAPKLANAAVGSQQIAAGAVGASQLALGSVNSAKIADGSILGVDIAAGVIGSNHLAAGSVGATQLGAGAVTAANIAAGAIGAAQLASPYQSGAIALGGTFTFAPLVLTQAFNPPFLGTPIVTLAPEQAAGDSAGLLNAQLIHRTASEFAAQVTEAPQVRVVDRSRYAPVAMVSPIVLTPLLLPAQPAFAAVRQLLDFNFDGTTTVVGRQLEFWHAEDPAGASWSSVVLGTNTSYAISTAIVGGRPALGFNRQNDTFYRPAFVRASNSSGTAWPAETIVNDAATNCFALRLAVINNKPAMAYANSVDGTHGLWFVSATDVNGTAWGQAHSVPAWPQASFASLGLVNLNGFPALFFSDYAHSTLMFSRALDTNGVSWAAPVIAAANLGVYAFSGAVINGRPAVAYVGYSEAKCFYRQANDTNGTSFGAPVTLGSATAFEASVLLSVVNNRPAVMFDFSGPHYAEAEDANGSSWRPPAPFGPTQWSYLDGFLQLGGGIGVVRFSDRFISPDGAVDYIWSGPGPERLHWTAVQP